ncbi:MAG: GNAT family N-acetyltransferase [Hydrogenophilales bacterium]|nr:GNAT family N-acetyltransferase [Hydrogenophilales bacterium]
MPVLINNKQYLPDFIRLNEAWIAHYFRIEEADRELARSPAKIIAGGGYIFTLLEEDQVAGVCALFKEDDDVFQLARMAVSPEHQGKGYGDALIDSTFAKLREIKASRVYLLSNTILAPAITLYKKRGFSVLSEGVHPVYARCNIVMEKIL